MKSIALAILSSAAFTTMSFAQNLISNGTFESGNVDFSSDYISVRTDTEERTYDVVRNPIDSHSGGASFGDHTTGGGFMLVANGSSNTSLAVWRQTVSVQQDRNYTFSGFAASWGHFPGSNEDPNPPFMLIFINGQQLTSGVQIPRTNGQWQNFTAVWKSDSATQATIEIRLGSTASDGNDISLDDLNFRSLASGTPEIQAVIYPAIEVTWPSETDRLYQPQWSPDLNAAHWFDLGPQIQGTGSELSIFDVTRTTPRRFYRILKIE